MALIPSAVVIAIAAYLFWRGLRVPDQFSLIPFVISVVLLILIIVGVIGLAQLGGLGGALAYVVMFGALIASIVAGSILVIGLAGKRKLASIVFIIIYPLMLFASFQIGNTNSSEAIVERNGDVVIQALIRYRADNGKYPASLPELIPKYLANLNQPETVWGWLYMTQEDDFWLGYVEDVDRLGYSTTLYSSKTPKWDYKPYDTRPFSLPPTPTNR